MRLYLLPKLLVDGFKGCKNGAAGLVATGEMPSNGFVVLRLFCLSILFYKNKYHQTYKF